MRHSTTSLISLTIISILIFVFVNLLLGTVSIPAKSVFNILFGIGDEPQIWQNIILKSRVPQTFTALVAG
ncbi:MAG: iron ABC transporter permease, partial [Bacteroidales bacterium]